MLLTLLLLSALFLSLVGNVLTIGAYRRLYRRTRVQYRYEGPKLDPTALAIEAAGIANRMLEPDPYVTPPPQNDAPAYDEQSIMSKLEAPAEAPFTPGQNHYEDFLVEFRGWLRRDAADRRMPLGSAMMALGLVAGHGRKYVARLVYEGRRPSPEGLESLMRAMGWSDEERARWHERLDSELNPKHW